MVCQQQIRKPTEKCESVHKCLDHVDEGSANAIWKTFGMTLTKSSAGGDEERPSSPRSMQNLG